MADIKFYFSGDKTGRTKYAIEHTKEMEENYLDDIAKSTMNTKVYGYDGVEPNPLTTREKGNIQIELAGMGSVEAIFTKAEGKTAVLNFASHKNPGGMFIQGSKAQEECLCAESYLYNVLRQFDDTYYERNRKELNRALYTNKALYTPDVKFFHDVLSTSCDVITCAAPNYTTYKRFNLGGDDCNFDVLKSRIKYILDIAEENEVDTLILGAYGCGVFGQNPSTVAKIFLKGLSSGQYGFKKVVFAIPKDFHTENYISFEAEIKKPSK